MVQKKLPLINSAHGSETRNIINELIKSFNNMGYTYNESLQKAHDILDEAQQTNDMNENVQQQIDTLIVESGTSEAEVIQARGGHPLLKDRLDENDTQLAQTVNKANRLLYTTYDEVFPTELTSKLPFNVSLKNKGELTHDYDLKQHYELPDIELYVNAISGGDDTTGDGTEEKPFRTLIKAWSVISESTWTKAVIRVVGEYRRTEVWSPAPTIPSGKTLAIIGDGDTTLFYAGDKGFHKTWTADGNAYQTNFTNGQNVIDTSVGEDKNGLMPHLKKVSSVSECQSTPNSWYTDNATLWVRTHDNRMPNDANIYLIMYNSGFSFTLEEDATVYLEGFTRYGNIEPNGVDGRGTFVQNNLKICSAGTNVQNNGLSLVDVKQSFSFNTIIAYSPKDGFNYHYANTPITNRNDCVAFEFNCISYANGRDAGDQASTQHEGVTIVRGNGDYDSQPGSAIVDVGGSLSVNVNCKMNGGVGMGINVSGENHKLILVNSIATTETDGQYSVRAENAKFRNNIVKGIVSTTNLEAI